MLITIDIYGLILLEVSARECHLADVHSANKIMETRTANGFAGFSFLVVLPLVLL